jgi:hypothetical protein
MRFVDQLMWVNTGKSCELLANVFSATRRLRQTAQPAVTKPSRLDT